MATAGSVSLRPPQRTGKDQEKSKAPPLEWLQGTWYIIHSTLPTWKDNRNPQMIYTPLPDEGGPNGGLALDDLVNFQPLNSDKKKSFHGIDRSASGDTSKWDWRGRGLLRVAASTWEILGWGVYGSSGEVPEGDLKNHYLVTFFQKTMLANACVGVISRSPHGLPEECLAEIKQALAEVDDSEVNELAKGLFAVKHDEKVPEY